ncbi:MAG: hypothetical protein HY033_07135 [Ignavibacteriae bacterium]|nr:hypothetical protein [Ignavibacteria bacterium]MBI3364666.1 hypothetical protein [Ignavibacteriota bacterium]
MAAADTFEHYISTMVKNSSPALRQYIGEQREYLLALRSEDERQRFVDDIIEELMRRKREM